MDIVIQNLVEKAKTITEDTIDGLAIDIGHLLEDLSLTSDQAKNIRLGLAYGVKRESNKSAITLMKLLSAYEYSRCDRENHEELIKEVRNATGQIWTDAGFFKYTVKDIQDDVVNIYMIEDNLCKIEFSIPIKQFAMFWRRVS